MFGGRFELSEEDVCVAQIAVGPPFGCFVAKLAGDIEPLFSKTSIRACSERLLVFPMSVTSMNRQTGREREREESHGMHGDG